MGLCTRNAATLGVQAVVAAADLCSKPLATHPPECTTAKRAAQALHGTIFLLLTLHIPVAQDLLAGTQPP